MDVKQAVTIAVQYFNELFPQRAQNAELEEVEYVDSSDTWRVTFGYDRPDPTGMRILVGQQPEREFKVVHLDSTGKPLSIKMRGRT